MKYPNCQYYSLAQDPHQRGGNPDGRQPPRQALHSAPILNSIPLPITPPSKDRTTLDEVTRYRLRQHVRRNARKMTSITAGRRQFVPPHPIVEDYEIYESSIAHQSHLDALLSFNSVGQYHTTTSGGLGSTIRRYRSQSTIESAEIANTPMTIPKGVSETEAELLYGLEEVGQLKMKSSGLKGTNEHPEYFDFKAHEAEIVAIASYLNDKEKQKLTLCSLTIFMILTAAHVIELTTQSHRFTLNHNDHYAQQFALICSATSIHWLNHVGQHPDFCRGQVVCETIPYFSVYLRNVLSADSVENKFNVDKNQHSLWELVQAKLLRRESVFAAVTSPPNTRKAKENYFNERVFQHKKRRISCPDDLPINLIDEGSACNAKPYHRRGSLPRRGSLQWRRASQSSMGHGLSVPDVPHAGRATCPVKVGLFDMLRLKCQSYMYWLNGDIPRFVVRKTNLMKCSSHCRVPPFNLLISHRMPFEMQSDKILQVLLKLISLFPVSIYSAFETLATTGQELTITQLSEFAHDRGDGRGASGLFASLSVSTNLSTLCELVTGWGSEVFSMANIIQCIYELHVDIRGDHIPPKLALWDTCNWLHGTSPCPPLCCDQLLLDNLYALRVTGVIPENFTMGRFLANQRNPVLRIVRIENSPDTRRASRRSSRRVHLKAFFESWNRQLAILSLVNVFPYDNKHLSTSDGDDINDQTDGVPMLGHQCGLRYLHLSNIRLSDNFNSVAGRTKSHLGIEAYLKGISRHFHQLRTLHLENITSHMNIFERYDLGMDQFEVSAFDSLSMSQLNRSHNYDARRTTSTPSQPFQEGSDRTNSIDLLSPSNSLESLGTNWWTLSSFTELHLPAYLEVIQDRVSPPMHLRILRTHTESDDQDDKGSYYLPTNTNALTLIPLLSLSSEAVSFLGSPSNQSQNDLETPIQIRDAGTYALGTASQEFLRREDPTSSVPRAFSETPSRALSPHRDSMSVPPYSYASVDSQATPTENAQWATETERSRALQQDDEDQHEGISIVTGAPPPEQRLSRQASIVRLLSM